MALYALAMVFVMVAVAVVTQTGEVSGQGLTDGRNASKCTVATSTRVVVNPQSTSILPAYSLRAWAIIQQPRNATNTIALSIDEGAAAVLGSGFELSVGTSSSPSHQFTFGLNTELPYTGEVTGIASAGTTTVLVTECRY